MRVLGICGSLRRASHNLGLLRAARDLAPHGLRVEIAMIGDLPLYNADVEAKGWPEPVVALRRRAHDAHAILFACPEYNHGVPGPLKNAYDWLSRAEGADGRPKRPGPRTPFDGKPCAVFGASPGQSGTIRAQQQLRLSLQGNAALTMPVPELFIPHAGQVCDADGNLTDPALRQRVGAFMQAFADWIARVGTPVPDTGEDGEAALDEALEETFPASDPPSRSEPLV
jgi:chromate reductase